MGPTEVSTIIVYMARNARVYALARHHSKTMVL